MTKFPELFAALAAPFEPHEEKQRQAPGGKKLTYITARTAMNRLDNTLGPENWWDSYAARQNSVECTLTIRLPDGSTVAKQDAGGYAGMSDQGDDDKSGYSDAFKRACAKFGVGRYLYRDGVASFAGEAGREPGDDTPLPPGPGARPAPPQPARQPVAQPSNGRPNGVPRTGKALFAWTKDMEQRHEVGLLKYLNGWAKLQEFPGRMVDWDGDQVAFALREATRKLASVNVRDQSLDEALGN